MEKGEIYVTKEFHGCVIM